VQKEIECADTHRRELDNLAILNYLRHPNIIDLLASYTYQKKHHLLFPRAEHGTLAALLTTPRSETVFESDLTLLSAVTGLSYAIAHVHEFFEHKIDLKLIGCHHDLRSQNVLISGQKFVLADFGLSKFKGSSEDSETPFRQGMGHYLAPECEDIDADFAPQRIRRSSDIWSFGCMLADITTYMICGHEGVADFEKKRMTVVRGFILHLFHNGPNCQSSAVDSWLTGLESEPQQTHRRMLVSIIRKILSMDPSTRPSATNVSRSLHFVVLSTLTARVEKKFADFKSVDEPLDMALERIRFVAWKEVMEVTTFEKNPELLWTLVRKTETQLYDVQDFLEQMERCLESCQQDRHRVSLVLSLTPLNDLLNEHLSRDQQARSRDLFKISAVESLGTTFCESGSQSLTLDKEIRLALALKRMTTLTECQDESESSRYRIDSRALMLKNRFGEHHIGSLTDSTSARQVLVEWRRYADNNLDEATSRNWFARLNAIVIRLSAERPASLRSLQCNGYLHDSARHAFGIVYDFPQVAGTPDADIQIMTLHQWITKTAAYPESWPALDDKFKLAYTLARSVLEFHLVGWVHKSINASNVSLFHAPGASTDSFINAAYITGFNHSRPDDPFADTEGIPHSEVIGYQHPKYRRNVYGYRAEYDYYSLGIVLMEIGFWRTFRSIAGFKDTYGAEHDQKIYKRIPLLQQYMGRGYCEAVTACIHGQFDEGTSHEWIAGRTSAGFERNVLSRLSRFIGSV
jgi:serine/threonine protein kinase